MQGYESNYHSELGIYYEADLVIREDLSVHAISMPFTFQAVLQTSHSRTDSYYLKIVIYLPTYTENN